MLLLLTTLGVVAESPTDVGAVPGDTQEAAWGLKTKGTSNAVANWDAIGWAIEQIGGTIYAGGNFLQVTNGPTSAGQAYLASFDATNGKWQSWFDPQVGNAVFALEASPDGALFVGGEMGTWNGQTIGALAKIDPVTGEMWPGWTSRVYGGTSLIRDLKIEADGYLYAVGSFTTVSHDAVPQSAGGAIRMDPITGVIDSTWKPTIDSRAIWGVSRSKTLDRIYLAGHFRNVNGQSNTGGFVAVDDSGTVVVDRLPTVPLNNCTFEGYCYEMYDVEATDQGTIWVGGVEHALYVLDEATLALERAHFTNCARNYSASCQRRGGEYQEIEYDGTNIWAGCHCWNDHLTDTSVIMASAYPTGTYTGEISAFAKYDPATGLRDESFDPYMSGTSGAFGMHYNTADGCVWVTGDITSIGAPGSQGPARSLVRLCDPAVADANPTPVMPQPGQCDASVEADGTTVTLTWDGVAGAASYVIRRVADGGGTAHWRGSATGTSFSDTFTPSSTYTYQVETKFVANQVGPATACTPDVTGPPVVPITAPVSCAVAEVGGGLDVTWPGVAGATDYIVWREVDQSGTDHWRGKVQTNAFTDTPKANSTLTYKVAAVDASSVSTRTVCTPDIVDNGPDPLAAPATCAAVAANGGIDVTWDPVTGATDYVIYRSVDGGTNHWRGKVQTTAFTDTPKPGFALVYSVEAVDGTGQRSPLTVCTGDLADGGGGGITVDPVASCTASVVGTDIVVTWPAAAGATDYVVYRQVDGDGVHHWRGKVQTLTFTDTIRTGSTLQYSVIVKGAQGLTSTRTICTPDLVL